ncbi:hypothetical protein [Halovivax cerinus]|uniref:Uncharacterized protein n=1 Tax=Halovivax cerinus TaxID=1487865 RepID=A0ABD5NQB1_9EURY|nr:hypothetical protein [Halovivax cerinus]
MSTRTGGVSTRAVGALVERRAIVSDLAERVSERRDRESAPSLAGCAN